MSSASRRYEIKNGTIIAPVKALRKNSWEDAWLAPEDYDDRLDRIRSLGLEVREGRSRVEGEGDSIYFYDHDNHMFELHSGTLEKRLRRYAEG